MYALNICFCLALLFVVGECRLLADKKTGVASRCSQSGSFKVTQVQFGKYIKKKISNATVTLSEDPEIYVPYNVYDTMTRQLQARQDGFTYGVPCADSDITSYPDLILTINGGELHIPPKTYINTRMNIRGLCLLHLSDLVLDYEYTLPNSLRDDVCELFGYKIE